MSAPVLLVGGAADLADSLLGLDIEVVKAATGTAALELVCDREPGLVLVPFALTDLDALELAAMIHGDELTRHVPILLTASHRQWDDVAHRAHAAGVVDYVPVPARLGLVRSKVRIYLELYEGRARAGRRLARLERSNSELREFAHAAAHDLKAPLRSVAAHARELCDPATSAADRAASAATISGALDRMNEMLTRMLEYATLDGAPHLAVEVDLDRVVAEVLADLAAAIAEATVRIEVAPLPTVPGDAAQLRRLFQNLIGNAIKYRRRDGQPWVRIDCAFEGTRARVDVADNGIGFDMKFHDEVFKPFRRLVPRKAGGAGIGMASARRIVERHGGTLRATSVVDQGSTFHVHLPIAAPQIATHRLRTRPVSTPPPPRPGGRLPRVLVVDDSDDDRALVGAAIEQRYEVVTADNAEAALALVTPELVAVVSDYHLPGNDGLWLLGQVAGRAAGIRRVLLTGCPDEHCHAAAAAGVVDRVVVKSFEQDEVARTLRALLATAAARPAATDA